MAKVSRSNTSRFGRVFSTASLGGSLGASLGVACLTAGSGVAHADAITLASLAPGSAYRLIFTTDGTTKATSSAISTYNTFVSN